MRRHWESDTVLDFEALLRRLRAAEQFSKTIAHEGSDSALCHLPTRHPEEEHRGIGPLVCNGRDHGPLVRRALSLVMKAESCDASGIAVLGQRRPDNKRREQPGAAIGEEHEIDEKNATLLGWVVRGLEERGHET